MVRGGSSWFMFCHGSWWFVMVQYIPDNFKIGVVSLMSQLQLVSWFVMVRHGLILLCHLVLNFIKTNAASSDNF